MLARRVWLPLVVCFALASFATAAWAIRFQLGESKDELKLDYDVSIIDHGTGRVTIVFTLRDEGRLKPLEGVVLAIPGEKKNADGGHWMDLSVPLNMVPKGKAHIGRVHLRKDWAERAEIRLDTWNIDGKQEALTGYYHVIPLNSYVKSARPPKE